MTHTSHWFARTLLAAALGVSLAACGSSQSTTPMQENGTASTSASTPSEPATSTTPTDAATPTTQAATFDGPKYITSTVTDAQVSDEAATPQETCVIQPNESLGLAESIGWDRSSITYNHIAKDWGTLTYRYEYITQTPADSADPEHARTTETGYFGEGQPVEHLQVNGHDIAYVMENSNVELVAIGIVDLEAQANGTTTPGTFVMLNAWEQRADGCAFTTSISCEVNEDANYAVAAETLLAEAYAPLEFSQEGTPAPTDAASCDADLAIVSADNSHSLVVHRTGDTLINYARHKVTLTNTAGDAGTSPLSIDFAPEGGLDALNDLSADTSSYSPEMGYTEVAASEVEELSVEGHAWHARVVNKTIATEQDTRVERELRTWTDVDGNALYVVAGMSENEDAATALTRVISGRVDLG